MKRAWQLLWQALREIFDEAAYERYLDRQQECAGPTSYAAFLAESRSQRERRPRCC
jgi:hypothetical protein